MYSAMVTTKKLLVYNIAQCASSVSISCSAMVTTCKLVVYSSVWLHGSHLKTTESAGRNSKNRVKK